MVPKLSHEVITPVVRFRAVLFRMVPKPCYLVVFLNLCFRAVLFRMVPKRLLKSKNI